MSLNIPQMSLTAMLPAALLETALAHLAILFLTGAGGDLTAARQAASQILANHHPETEDELRLATEIISFGFHALEALNEAGAPGISLHQKLRLRGSAVSLSRGSHKSQRRLDQLQRARRANHAAVSVEAPVPQSEPDPPGVEPHAKLIEAPRTSPVHTKTNSQSWTQGYQQRLLTESITAKLRKNQANAVLSAAPSIAAITAQASAPAG